jgi:hypothetical protein
MKKPLPPTECEREILAEILLEMRRANGLGTQLLITIDPYVAGGGANVFFSYNEAGDSIEFTGQIRKAPWPRKRKNPRS